MRAALVGVIAVCCALLVRAQPRHPPVIPDPGQDAVRLELRLTTDARFASVRVLGAAASEAAAEHFAVADGRRIEGPADLRTAVLENLLAMSSNVEGSSATGAFRVVLTRIEPSTTVSWLLNVQPGHRAAIEIINVNDESRPRVVDHFEGVAGVTFNSSGAQLLLGGPLPQPSPRRAKMVLGHYYPWYLRDAWADPQMIDQPLRPYSADDIDDVRRNLEEAKSVGLDAVIVNWQIDQPPDSWNYRRLRIILQAARQVGMKVSVHTLPWWVDAGHDVQAEIETIVRWLDQIMTWWAPEEAFLRVEGRPVIFTYAWPYVTDSDWREAMARVHARGQNPLIIADTTDPSAHALADAISPYANQLFAPDITLFARRLSLGGRMYHLLGASYGPPRISMVTISPGYDERSLRGRTNQFVVDRENGAFYERQWAAAFDSRPDWIVITTWNEWWENTHIEASQRYGELYPSRTKFWTAVFKAPERH